MGRHTDECDYRRRHGERYLDPDCWCQIRIKRKWQKANPLTKAEKKEMSGWNL